MDPLTRQAMLGTRRAPGQPVEPAYSFEEVLPIRTATSDAQSLLFKAGVRATLQRAGVQTIPVIPIEPAPDESAGSSSIAVILREMLGRDPQRLFGLGLGMLRSAGLVVPERLLPDLLSFTTPQMRNLVRPVLGERGLWLSRFQETWAWAREAGESSMPVEALREQWDEGALPDRLQALRQFRSIDAGSARHWLEEVFSKEKADVRTALLQTLEEGLQAADETFLEQTLSDRSKGVRALAADLLSRIPTSRLSERMRDRMRQVVRFDSSAPQKQRLQIELSQDLPDDWQRDGIPENPPAGEGRQAFWLRTLIGLVPVSYWVEISGNDPNAFVEAATFHEDGKILLQGWLKAIERFPHDADAAKWRSALWDVWIHASATGAAHMPVVQESLLQLASLSENQELEQRLTTLVQHQPNMTDLSIPELLSGLAEPWSLGFSRNYLRWTRALVQARIDKGVQHWCEGLSLAALAIPVEAFDDALQPWSIRSESERFWLIATIERRLQEFGEVVRLRQSLWQEIQHATA